MKDFVKSEHFSVVSVNYPLPYISYFNLSNQQGAFCGNFSIIKSQAGTIKRGRKGFMGKEKKEKFSNILWEWIVKKNLTDLNNEIELDDIAKVKKISLHCSGGGGRIIVSGYSNLIGIEYFTELEELRCNNIRLESIDVSKNTMLKVLNCSGNYLTELNVSKNTMLKVLNCSGNKLTELNVSNNKKLETLICGRNKLKKLELSENTALKTLWCYQNQLSKFDLSKNTALKELRCCDNQLPKLQLSKNTLLEILWCDKKTELIPENIEPKELKLCDYQMRKTKQKETTK